MMRDDPAVGEARPARRGNRRLSIALLAIAVIAGSALRFTDLARVPPGLNQDEAVDGYDAYSLARTGRDHLGHPLPVWGLESFGDWVSPLLTFLTVPAVGVLGLRTEVVRGVPAAMGVLAIPILYLLGVELFRRRSMGLVGAWYMALSPWAVHRSRYAIPTSLVPTMVALTLLAIIWTIRRRSPRGLVASGIAAGLTIASYPTMKLFIPLLLLATVVIFGRRLWRISHEALVYAIVAFTIIAGPIYFLSLADPGARMRMEQVSIFRGGKGSLVTLARQYASYFSPRVFFVSGSPHAAHAPSPPGTGVELRILTPFVLAGLLWLLIAASRKLRSADVHPARYALAGLLLYPAPAAVTITSANLQRGAQLLPFLALLAAVGAVGLGDVARRLLARVPRPGRRWIVVIAGGLLAVALVVELGARYRYYFRDYPKRPIVLDYFQYGLDEALAYAGAREPEEDIIWVDGANEGYIYVLYVGRTDPSLVHRSLQVEREPGVFNEVSTMGKYRFGAPAGFIAADLALVHTVYDPGGRPVWEIRGGTVAPQGRVLVVRRP
jgi:4-amino-4-deoxy-L-arabinose transferase-like glycosyltransferase